MSAYVHCLSSPKSNVPRYDTRSFTAIALGFAIFGQYSFGYLLVQFHNMPASFSTVLRFSLGDFEYDELTLVRAVLPAGWAVVVVVVVAPLHPGALVAVAG